MDNLLYFDRRSLHALSVAQNEALLLRQGTLGQEHLLLALAKTDTSVSQRVLKHCNLTYEQLSLLLSRFPYQNNLGKCPRIELTWGAQTALVFALRCLRNDKLDKVRPEHILMGIMTQPDQTIADLLEKQHVGQEDVLKMIQEFIQGEDRELERFFPFDYSFRDEDSKKVIRMIHQHHVSIEEGIELLRALRCSGSRLIQLTNRDVVMFQKATV